MFISLIDRVTVVTDRSGFDIESFASFNPIVILVVCDLLLFAEDAVSNISIFISLRTSFR